MLKESLIGNFEAQARVVRVFCVDNQELLSSVREDVAERLAEEAVKIGAPT